MKKLGKTWYLKIRKNFWDEIKEIFAAFKRPFHWLSKTFIFYGSKNIVLLLYFLGTFRTLFNTLFSPSMLPPCKCWEHLLKFIREIIRFRNFEFLIGIIPKLEAYSEPCQTSKILCFGKILTAESHQLYLQNAPP